MPNAIINGVDLYYESHGEGAPLLLIAGLASDSQSWQPILPELSRNYKVIIFDNRGVGRTKPQDVETSIQLMADDCIGLIKHLRLKSVNLLGHSMGGFVALDCAIRYPQYFPKLILAASSAFISERNNEMFHDWVSYLDNEMKAKLWFRNMFYWIFTKQFFKNERKLEISVQLAIEYPYPQTKTAFKNQIDAIKEFNCLNNLAGIQSKTMVICGKEDLLITPEDSSEALGRIPGVRFSYVDHAAHAIHLEKPKEFVNLIRIFLGLT